MVYRESGRPCPSCQAAFFADAQYESADRFECGSCGARFVSFAQLHRRAPRLTQALMISASAAPQRPRACPRCGEPMRITALSDVQVDLCPVDGVWFDSAELETLAGLAGDASP